MINYITIRNYQIILFYSIYQSTIQLFIYLSAHNTLSFLKSYFTFFIFYSWQFSYSYSFFFFTSISRVFTLFVSSLSISLFIFLCYRFKLKSIPSSYPIFLRFYSLLLRSYFPSLLLPKFEYELKFTFVLFWKYPWLFIPVGLVLLATAFIAFGLVVSLLTFSKFVVGGVLLNELPYPTARLAEFPYNCCQLSSWFTNYFVIQ